MVGIPPGERTAAGSAGSVKHLTNWRVVPQHLNEQRDAAVLDKQLNAALDIIAAEHARKNLHSGRQKQRATHVE
jgi:hypothetical protein